MKKSILFLAMLFITAASLMAQNNAGTNKGGKKTPEERADKYADKMQKDLGLTAEQRNKVRDLALTRAKKMDELRDKYKGKEGDKQVWKDERKKARDEFHAGMKSVLSPEQFAKWEAQRKKQADKKATKPKGGKGKAKGKGKGKADTAATPAPTPAPADTDGRDNDDPELDGE